MTFIIFLIALAAERYLNLGAMLYRFNWFPCYVQFIKNRLGSTALWQGNYQILASILLPLLIIIALIYYIPAIWIGWTYRLIVGALIFLYCLGPDLFHQVNAYLNAKTTGDARVADQFANQILGDEQPIEASQEERFVLNKILFDSNERVFAVLFWFFIAGPVAAVLYRAVSILRTMTQVPNNEHAYLFPTVSFLQGLLDWAPARVTALGYSLLGKLGDTFGYWLDNVFSGIETSARLLVESGRRALGLESDAEIQADQVKAALVLVDKTAIAYLVLVAVLTLLGWVFTM